MADKSDDSSTSDQFQQDNNPNRENSTPEVSNLTPDSQSVQDQEIESRPPDSMGSPEAGPTVEPASQAREEESEYLRLSRDLQKFERNLSELMAWKEDLELKSLGANINLAYYHLWRSDANSLFQRCVIIRKRLQNYSKNKGA